MPEGLASSQPNRGTEIFPSGILTGLAHPKLLESTKNIIDWLDKQDGMRDNKELGNKVEQ